MMKLMTKKEREQIKLWNIQQGSAQDNAEAEYRALRKKYLGLNGYCGCSYNCVMLDIATCSKVSKKERLKDLATLSHCLQVFGRMEALMDFIFMVH